MQLYMQLCRMGLLAKKPNLTCSENQTREITAPQVPKEVIKMFSAFENTSVITLRLDLPASINNSLLKFW